MANNKVVYFNQTLMDISDSTVSADKVLNGYSFYGKDGVKKTGSVSFATYYTGTDTPSSSVGTDGDVYLKVVS